MPIPLCRQNNLQVMHTMPDLVLQRSGPNGGRKVHDRDTQVVATSVNEERTCKAEDDARPADEDVARGYSRTVTEGKKFSVLVGPGGEGRWARWLVLLLFCLILCAAMSKKLEKILYFEVLCTTFFYSRGGSLHPVRGCCSSKSVGSWLNMTWTLSGDVSSLCCLLLMCRVCVCVFVLFVEIRALYTINTVLEVYYYFYYYLCCA